MRKIFVTIAFIITVQSLLAQGEVIITESNKNIHRKYYLVKLMIFL